MPRPRQVDIVISGYISEDIEPVVAGLRWLFPWPPFFVNVAYDGMPCLLRGQSMLTDQIGDAITPDAAVAEVMLPEGVQWSPSYLHHQVVAVGYRDPKNEHRTPIYWNGDRAAFIGRADGERMDGWSAQDPSYRRRVGLVLHRADSDVARAAWGALQADGPGVGTCSLIIEGDEVVGVSLNTGDYRNQIAATQKDALDL